MCVCPFEGHLLDASTDHCHVEGVGGVADVECDSGIPQNVFVFLAAFNIDEEEIPSWFDPCLSDVGGAVWHQRGDVREGFGLYELLDGIWKRLHVVTVADYVLPVFLSCEFKTSV